MSRSRLPASATPNQPNSVSAAAVFFFLPSFWLTIYSTLTLKSHNYNDKNVMYGLQFPSNVDVHLRAVQQSWMSMLMLAHHQRLECAGAFRPQVMRGGRGGIRATATAASAASEIPLRAFVRFRRFDTGLVSTATFVAPRLRIGAGERCVSVSCVSTSSFSVRFAKSFAARFCK